MSSLLPRLTSRCPPRASSWSSWHQIPTGKLHRSHQMVKDWYHKVDPCPRCAPEQTILESNRFHICKTQSVRVCQSIPAAVINESRMLENCPAQMTRTEVESTVKQRVAFWVSSQPDAARRRPLGEPVRSFQLSVVPLIPVDLHSSLKEDRGRRCSHTSLFQWRPHLTIDWNLAENYWNNCHRARQCSNNAGQFLRKLELETGKTNNLSLLQSFSDVEQAERLVCKADTGKSQKMSKQKEAAQLKEVWPCLGFALGTTQLSSNLWEFCLEMQISFAFYE